MPVNPVTTIRARFFDGLESYRGGIGGSDLHNDLRDDDDVHGKLLSSHPEEFGSARYTRLYGMSQLAYAITLIIFVATMISVVLIGLVFAPIITGIALGVGVTLIIPVWIGYFAMVCVNR